ncbi:hypothetical protein GA0115256_14686 [Streptomyces sp. DconLS]|nr:hypothetical protein GA0115256_14686 [Streptomyces sp. DconLS]
MERLVVDMIHALEAVGLLVLVATRLTNEISAFVEALKRLFRGPGGGPEGRA